MACGLDQTCSAANSGSASRALAFVVIGGGFASFLRTTILNRAQDNITKSLRTKLFSAVLNDRDMEWFVSGGGANTKKVSEDGEKKEEDAAEDKDASASNPSGAIGSILTEDINKASESVTTTFANILRSCNS